MVVEVSWFGATLVLPTCTVTYWSRAWSPPFGDWAAGQHSNMITNPKHTSNVKVMGWPSMSPDLNPIEHLWGILKRKVEERKVSNIHQLHDVIMEEWKRTPVATCEALVNSMPKRVKAVLAVATQNIDILGPVWTFSLRGVLTFVKRIQQIEVLDSSTHLVWCHCENSTIYLCVLCACVLIQCDGRPDISPGGLTDRLLSVIINPIIGLHHTLLNSTLGASLSRSNPHYKIRCFCYLWAERFWSFSLCSSRWAPQIPLQKHHRPSQGLYP